MVHRFRGDAVRRAPLEQFFAARENVVQRILKVRGGPGEVTSNLIDIFLVALLDLVPEQRLERPVAQSLRMPSGMIGNDVRHQCASKTLCT